MQDASSECPNCQTVLAGHYCHGCGQSSHNPVRSFGHAVEEVFESFWHLDGKIFASLRRLLEPGRLALDYLAGQRARYVPPMRLFVVLCALAFFVGAQTVKIQAVPVDDPAQAERILAASSNPDGLDGMIQRQVLDTTSKMSRPQALEQLRSGFMRSLSTLMFVLAPSFALLLKLVYLGRGKLYLEHLVVALYSHAFICLVLVLQFALVPLRELAATSMLAVPLTTLAVLLWAWIPAYLLWMQQRVYGGAWWATLARFLLLGLVHLSVIGIGTLALLLSNASRL
jgi:hypothetical protein